MSTWHGSCYACTCTSSPHKSQRIARPVPSGARAIGVRAVSSPGPDATLILTDAAFPGIGYDPATGYFSRNGCGIGNLEAKGYVLLHVSGRVFRAHRLAWRMYFGAWPDQNIDHKNGRRDDNRIDNLRQASTAQNNRNKRPTVGRGLPKGVSPYTHGKRYFARISIDGRNVHLGTFETPELAHLAYREAASRLHGDFARVE